MLKAIIPYGVRLGDVLIINQGQLLKPSTLGYTCTFSFRNWTCSISNKTKKATALPLIGRPTPVDIECSGILLKRQHFSFQARSFHLSLLSLRNMTDNKFACDYAKLGTSGCKKCKTKIAKGELRIAKLAANPFGDGDMKMYHHPKCIFETFIRARATTKIIEGLDDIENHDNLKDEDRDLINGLIKETLAKKGSPMKTPRKTAAKKAAATSSPAKQAAASPAKTAVKADPEPSPSAALQAPSLVAPSDQNEKDNAFRQFRRLCADIAEEPSYNGKTSIVSSFLKKGTSGDGFNGDLFLLFKFLLPGVVKTVYNINSKQLAKIFSQVFGASQEEMVEDLDKGDVAETVKDYFEKSSKVEPQTKSTLSLHEVENLLTELSRHTKEDDHQRVLTKMAKKSTSNDLKMIVRLIKHDLRINAGAKHILDALDPNAYEAFKASRNLKDVIDRVIELRKTNGEKPGLSKKLSIKANLMTAVQPMLAEACKSVEFAFKRCPNGMYSEIKYDGERVQVHKQGDSFHYFSRSLKPVQAHKVNHFKDYIPKAFPYGNDIILDAEVLLIDTNTGKPLPFGTLGVHKKAAFKEANVCLFVFDCLHFNGESLMNKPIKERRKFLLENMKEVKNHVMFSEMKHITEPGDLKDMMLEVFREGLEGLVLKDVMSVYEPGKRHWLKVKKDYLAEGAMADSADLVVLGTYFGTGNKGGLMSVFLMGVYDKHLDVWKTVTKCHGGFDDALLEKLQKQLDVVKISKDYAKIPSWLRCNRNVVPDFVVKDPKNSPVWEITGAEFSKSDSHTADGMSIRFPRMTKIRKDKSWKEATDLDRLKELYKKSKEFSDIPDFLGGSPTKKGKFAKKAPITLKKGSTSSEERMETDEDSNSVPSTPVKETPKKRKLDSDDNEDHASSKKVKKEESKPSCKYGATCYQKNPEHRAQFSHSANGTHDVGEAIKENKHLPDVFKGMKFYLEPKVEKSKLMERYIIAFDGDIVADFDTDSATHIVAEKGGEASPKVVSSEWVWKCIKAKKFLPK